MSVTSLARPVRGPDVWLSLARFIRDPIPILRSLHDEHGSLVAFPNDPLRQQGIEGLWVSRDRLAVSEQPTGWRLERNSYAPVLISI